MYTIHHLQTSAITADDKMEHDLKEEQIKLCEKLASYQIELSDVSENDLFYANEIKGKSFLKKLLAKVTLLISPGWFILSCSLKHLQQSAGKFSSKSEYWYETGLWAPTLQNG